MSLCVLYTPECAYVCRIVILAVTCIILLGQHWTTYSIFMIVQYLFGNDKIGRYLSLLYLLCTYIHTNVYCTVRYNRRHISYTLHK